MRLLVIKTVEIILNAFLFIYNFYLSEPHFPNLIFLGWSLSGGSCICVLGNFIDSKKHPTILFAIIAYDE